MSIAALILAAVFVPDSIAQPAVDFDQGVDVSAVLSSARRSSARETEVPWTWYAAGPRYDRECANFRFGPSDPAQSRAVWLTSREWILECRDEGTPRHPRRRCWEFEGMTYHKRVQITLQDRLPLQPWEQDAFRICLSGYWVDIFQESSAYDYERVGGSAHDGDIVEKPVRKTPMDPDAAGITAELSTALGVTLKDKWASSYNGEQTGIKLQLKRDVRGFDPTLVELEKLFPAAPQYKVDLLEYASRFSQKLEPGAKYYIRYSFQRIGSISKDRWTSVEETQPVVYQP